MAQIFLKKNQMVRMHCRIIFNLKKWWSIWKFFFTLFYDLKKYDSIKSNMHPESLLVNCEWQSWNDVLSILTTTIHEFTIQSLLRLETSLQNFLVDNLQDDNLSIKKITFPGKTADKAAQTNHHCNSLNKAKQLTKLNSSGPSPLQLEICTEHKL